MKDVITHFEYRSDSGRIETFKIPGRLYTGFDDRYKTPICDGDKVKTQDDIIGKIYYNNGFRWSGDDTLLDHDVSYWGEVVLKIK